tara:strand:- start:285 stop:725 length:441 start_codon:yes stop_codon:yes gene_type:complete
LNVHISEWCGGCQFHSFPYEAKIPVSIDGTYPLKTFNSKEDVWDVIRILIEETENMNEEMGKSFDIASSISQQLPFFCCVNNILNNSSQKDISQYIYCTDLGVSPYSGSYGNQPKKWIDKFFLIKNALGKIQERQIKKAKDNNGKN